MPSPITVNIKMEPYLIAYLVDLYGAQPIVFPRKDRLAGILPMLCARPGKEDNQFEKYGEENLEIVLPYMEEKNVLYHNYISPKGQKLFERMVKRLFKAQFHDFMNEAERARATMKESVDTFIDVHRLDPSVSDTLIKERQRYKENLYLERWRDKKKRQFTESFVQNERD